MRYGWPVSSSLSSSSSSVAKNSFERMSQTTATRFMRLPGSAVSATSCDRSAGGRLSMQKYPRSSNVWMASERPAPERPVMMTISAGVAGGASSTSQTSSSGAMRAR